MNYEQELEKVTTKDNAYFRPTVGVFNIEVLEEPVETTFTEKDGRIIDQIKLEIFVDDLDKKVWYVSRGVSMKSIWGQLMLLGKYKGKLKGQKFTLQVVQAPGREGKLVNNYTVLEATRLQQKLNAEKVKTEVVM